MADEVDALVTFYEAWQQNGVGPDGLPMFENVVMVRMAKPPLTEVNYVATEEHQRQAPDAYRQFEKQRGVRDVSVKGYPLALWPVVSPADLQMCAARDIYTVEQLAPKLDDKTAPPAIRELALRAKKLLSMQGKIGQFEEVINQLTGERDALAEQLREASGTISAQNALINTLKMRAA